MTITQNDQLKAIYNRLFERETYNEIYYFMYSNLGTALYAIVKDIDNNPISIVQNKATTSKLVALDNDSITVTFTDTHTCTIYFKKNAYILYKNSTVSEYHVSGETISLPSSYGMMPLRIIIEK